jgi:hypothetical protein
LRLQRFQDQVTKGLVLQNIPATSVLERASKAQTSRSLKKKTQQVLKIISDSSVKTEADIQAAFDSHFVKLISSKGMQYRSTFQSQVFRKMKPDALIVIEHGPSDGLHTVGILEYENILGDVFSDDHKEKVIIYNEFALGMQLHRPIIISLLCSSKWALVVRSIREGDVVTHEVSNAFSLKSDYAVEVFSTYCSMTLEEHHFFVPRIPGFVPKQILGMGSFSVVFEIESEKDQKSCFAAKVYFKLPHFNTECNMLKLLAENKITGVPQIEEEVQVSCGKRQQSRVLVLLPVAQKIEAPGFTEGRSLTLKDIEDAVETLRKLHNLKVIHRDIRPPNLLLFKTILICDFGCSLLQDGSKV